MRALGSPVLSSRATPADAAQAVYRSIWAALAEWRLLTLPSRLSGEGPRSRRAGLTVLELALQQYERIGSHVGVQQRAVPVVSFAAVEHQPIAHRGERLAGAWEKLGEQDLRANVTLLSVGALAPLNRLGDPPISRTLHGSRRSCRR